MFNSNLPYFSAFFAKNRKSFCDVDGFSRAVSANPKKIISSRYSSVNEIRPTKSMRIRLKSAL